MRTHNLVLSENQSGKLQSGYVAPIPVDPDFTITGTGFGTKDGIALFDNYEDFPTGAVTDDVGQLQISISGGTSITNSVSHSGTKSLEHDYSAVNFPKTYREFSTRTQSAYISCWWRFGGTNVGAVSVWKLTRFNTGASDPYNNLNKFSAEYTASSGSGVPTALSSTTTLNGASGEYAGSSEVASRLDLFTADTWHFMEWEIDSGTVEGTDGVIRQRMDGVTNLLWTNTIFRTTEQPDLIKFIMTPINGFDSAGTRDIIYNIDELYTDGSMARVVMTNNATYGSSTNWAAQPVVSWSDTEIGCLYNRGSFTIGATAYRHVFDSDGALVYTSPAYTVE
jgi:hypothetical protein